MSNSSMGHVRSGYHLLVNLSNVGVTAGSSTAQERINLWRTLWHLKLPNKVKNFTWNACLDNLPTKMNSLKRGVLSSAICALQAGS